MADEAEVLKPIEWVKSARTDLKRFPDEVKYQVGSALFQVQKGRGHPSIKILRGFGGAAVREIKADDESGTFRVVFTVQFAKAIYVLHSFQKKSKSGSKTPKWKWTALNDDWHLPRFTMPRNTDDEVFETGSGNVFADLGLPDPDMAMKKAELAAKIAERIDANGWSQTKAAAMMAIDQPKVSAIIRGRLKDFSLERLITCLERLGQPVGFVFAPRAAKPRTRKTTIARTRLPKVTKSQSKRIKVPN